MNNNISQKRDLQLISYYTGYVIVIIGSLMLIPLVTSLVLREFNSSLNFLISFDITLIIGIFLMLIGRKSVDDMDFQWKHGLIISSFSWIILTMLCAIPSYMSGYYKNYIDAVFDIMSGFTTTGLVLIQDLDHIPLGLNMWRHVVTFLGGQGMVVLALSLLTKNTIGAYKMYVGEGKDIELLPNVKNTAKIIWLISMIYLIIGTITLWIDGIFIGLKPVSAFFHGLFIFMSSWSTGGFAPMSQNIQYYHSLSYEIITLIFCIIGSFNFGLHYAIWQGNKKELIKNIEIQSFCISVTLLSFLAVIGISKFNVYKDAVSIFRRVIYNLISAHTTTGFGNIYARQFALKWGNFAIFIMIIAMLIGGSACSTAGGFKGLRVGIIFKGLIMDVKKLLISERKVKIFKFHYMKDNLLSDEIVKSSLTIIMCYIILFCIGTALGIYYGYEPMSAAFESASATGNVGISIGITSCSMPLTMKIYYIIAMYLGRLEFMSVFAFVGFTLGGIKKLCRRYI